MDPHAADPGAKGEQPTKGAHKGGYKGDYARRPPPVKGDRAAPKGNKGKAKGKPKGKGGDGGKGRGKGKARHVPRDAMAIPPDGEHFWDTLLAPVEAPSTGEAVAPIPIEPAVEPAAEAGVEEKPRIAVEENQE